jgi:hypothetical protein
MPCTPEVMLLPLHSQLLPSLKADVGCVRQELEMRAKAAEERLATLQTEKFALEDQLMDSRRAWASETQRCVQTFQSCSR